MTRKLQKRDAYRRSVLEYFNRVLLEKKQITEQEYRRMSVLIYSK